MSNRLDSMVTDAVVTNSSAAVSGAARASNLGPSRLAAKYMRSTFGQLDRISARHSPSIHGNHQYLAKVPRCSARNTGRMLSRTIAPLMNKAILDDHSIRRSEEHTSELQSLMRTSYTVFCLNKKTSDV